MVNFDENFLLFMEISGLLSVEFGPEQTFVRITPQLPFSPLVEQSLNCEEQFNSFPSIMQIGFDDHSLLMDLVCCPLH